VTNLGSWWVGVLGTHEKPHVLLLPHHGTDLAFPIGMRSRGPSPKKNMSVTELLRAYWAKREARGQEASIPPPLSTDPPAPPLSGPAQKLPEPGAETPIAFTESGNPTPTIPPNGEDDDGVAFAEFRLRLLRRRR
jgi:hypothetical protein